MLHVAFAYCRFIFLPCFLLALLQNGLSYKDGLVFGSKESGIFFMFVARNNKKREERERRKKRRRREKREREKRRKDS